MDPEGVIKEWIYEELERQGREGTTEEYSKVVDELPDMVQQSDIKSIVARLFPIKSKNLTIEELKKELNGFIGTQNWYAHFTGFGTYTDGVKHLADKAGAYWLIDAIFSYQCKSEIRAMPFQVWMLKVAEDRTAVLEMRQDRDEPVEVCQKFEYTDFPVGEIKLWMEDGVLLLPSEH